MTQSRWTPELCGTLTQPGPIAGSDPFIVRATALDITTAADEMTVSVNVEPNN
jgi:hypothetical protein